MQHLEVNGAVRHIYIYVIRQLKVNSVYSNNLIFKIRVVEKNMEETLNKCFKF
jgi:hypothetical protein